MTVQECFNLAVMHHQNGRLAEAEGLYRQILQVQPGHADALAMLGMIAFGTGACDAALQLIDAAIGVNPNIAEYHGNRAVVLTRMERRAEAIVAYQRAMALNPRAAEFHNNLGDLLQAAGDATAAMEQFAAAVLLRPHYAEAFYNLGNAASALRRTAEAVDAYRQALALRPDWVELLNNLGNVLCDRFEYEPALEIFRRAIALKPESAQSYNNLGNALRGLGKLDDAESAFRQAIALRSDLPDAANNLACVLSGKGQLLEAERLHRAIIAQRPDFAPAHWELAAVLLAQGDYLQGWDKYEWRWKVPALRLPAPPASPRWDGSELNGKTILLHAEQGLGDHIQFARYIPLVLARGGKVILACQAELVAVLRSMGGIADCVAANEPPPKHDVHCPLLSLPYVLGSGGDIPAKVPYLFADESLVEQWRLRLPATERRKVGLVWNGRQMPDPFRSVPFEQLAALGEVGGIELISLQTGDAANLVGSTNLKLTEVGSHLKTFADTAAVIANLDVVITIDTATAHLAAAMGKPTWIVLRHAPDWRWKMSGESCPWYPTARLFRQEGLGDWSVPINRVVEELRQ